MTPLTSCPSHDEADAASSLLGFFTHCKQEQRDSIQIKQEKESISSHNDEILLLSQSNHETSAMSMMSQANELEGPGQGPSQEPMPAQEVLPALGEQAGPVQAI